MAITSVGYPGPITADLWAGIASSLGADYGVVGAGDFRVSVVSAAARTVKVSAGQAYGKGIFDTSDAEVTIQLNTIASGTRWDLVGLKRTWSALATTVDKVTGSSSQTAVFASRPDTPGTVDFQPLALVQLTAGNSVPTAVIDLRVWQANGGAVANDVLALQYLNTGGTEVWVGSVLWHRYVDGAGALQWERTNSKAVPFLDYNGIIQGTVPSNGDIRIQAGSRTTVSSASGYGRIIFPTPFPNGLLTIILSNGDSTIDQQFGHVLTFAPAGGATLGIGDKTGVWYSVQREGHPGLKVPNLNHRVNWFAVGF